MGWTCSAEGRELHVVLTKRNLKEIDHWEDLEVDGRVILKRMSQKYVKVWAGLISFRTLVYTVMNLRVI
jgi:hypothetical protein